GKLLPLVYLDEQLELRAPRKRHDQDETVNIVVLRVEDREFGLVVDAITDTQEIVVKPLGHQLKALRTYAGTTIMGDGAVSLILDVLGLAQKGNILTEGTNRVANESLSANQLEKNENDSLLIVDPGNGTRAAIQLSNVARLEEFDSSMVERSGNSEVVQYRGQILPLIHLSGGFQNYGSPDPSSTNSTSLHVVVHSMGTQSVGIIVGKIVDIVSVRLAKNENNRSNSRVIQDRVTEMVDLTALIRSSCPEFLD
ncbi:MAG: two-component system chemotaxis sensor kinase CheA, partial [Pirellulaceae bacterium]